MALWRLRKGIACVAAVAFFAAACLALRAVNVSRLSAIAGDRSFYLDSASSQALCKKRLSLADLARVKGESVTFTLDAAPDPDALARQIAEKYGAEILALEYAGGTVSYYCYTEKWTDGVCVAGRTVNLHIAVADTRVAVGSPIVFGGF